MATHSSILAWRIPGTEEPSGLPSMGLQRVGHDWSNLETAAAGTSYYSSFLFLESSLAGCQKLLRTFCIIYHSRGESILVQIFYPVFHRFQMYCTNKRLITSPRNYQFKVFFQWKKTQKRIHKNFSFCYSFDSSWT